MRTEKFLVIPKLPEKLRPLLEIAHNMWWSWNPEAVALFQMVDRNLWEETRHNPVKMLGMISEERLKKLEDDDVVIAHMERVKEDLDEYMAHTTWYQRVHGGKLEGRIAYFSAEYGLHECLSLYSGGLGILAGDLLKSSSDLGLPIVGVGLLYRYGYFHQYLNREGMQAESYEPSDFHNMPIRLVRNEENDPVRIEVDFPGRKVFAHIWRVQVGRIPLFLLDADIEENDSADREVTFQLYGGDRDMRIRQEIFLGIGGMRALKVLEMEPTVCHMNEGHSAFMALERIADLMKKEGLSFEEARIAVVSSNIFTTHTPVSSGIDVFARDMIEFYFSDYVRNLGITVDELMALGRQDPHNRNEPLSMAVLALKLSTMANGVSRLHGRTSRKMWQYLWPNVPVDEVPIKHVTNGVHTQSWFSDEIARLYDRYLGPRWLEDPTNREIWERVSKIPDSELWRAKERLRERLVTFARKKLKEQLIRRGAHKSLIDEASSVLDPDALTMGFARRFAAYKRATLIFKDPERLAKILNDPERPVQILLAGKAHPRDQQGKNMIRHIIHIAKREEFRKRVVFIEDYDIEVARNMVQGVDVWLNTPRRPLEASGTSGMKVPVNGGINLSTLDGWWDEAYKGTNGWAIGSGEEYADHEYQDHVESLALYDLLEKEVVPLFYRRGDDGLPRQWIEMAKESIRTCCSYYNTTRMVEEYIDSFYLPALLRWNMLSCNNMGEAKALAKWKKFLSEHWNEISIVEVKTSADSECEAGDELEIKAKIHLGAIKPQDIRAEIYQGVLNHHGEIIDGESTIMSLTENGGGNTYVYSAKLRCLRSGQHAFSVRVLPDRATLAHPFELGLIKWWE